jgi:hypothetical protein
MFAPIYSLCVRLYVLYVLLLTPFHTLIRKPTFIYLSSFFLYRPLSLPHPVPYSKRSDALLPYLLPHPFHPRTTTRLLAVFISLFLLHRRSTPTRAGHAHITRRRRGNTRGTLADAQLGSAYCQPDTVCGELRHYGDRYRARTTLTLTPRAAHIYRSVQCG